MDQSGSFEAVRAAVEQLSVEEQAALVAILQQHAAERGLRRVVEEVRDAQREFAGGRSQPTNVGELMDEILS